jgi:copper chaperone
MISFTVSDMTCGHCVASITKAVKSVDQGADVRTDLATHRVEIDPTRVSATVLRDAITEAGFTPVAIETDARPAIAAAASGCKGCCG